MALIPEHTIERIREANDIVDVISEYVQLKRSGRNWFGRCPFHDEKTPSFSVSPDKQIYHCFGCGAGGNVINFIMEHERLDFLSAVKLLADRVNIEIETTQVSPEQRDEQASYYNLHELAARIYTRTLEGDQGKAAREYLARRKLSEETLKQFRVGFVPDTWETVTLEAMKLGLPRQILERSGLFMSRKDKSFYDRFRSRIMFPIIAINGRVQAFGGRIFGEAEGAKYMNSPETPIYHKGRTLYGLNLTKDRIRETRTAILVEGYMDLVRLYQGGFTNVVAGTGTALTRQQATIIKRFADQVFVCYDSDAAGIKAAQRAGLVLLDVGLETRVLELPAGEDPDSFFNDSAVDDFKVIMEEADEYIPFVLASQSEALRSTTSRSNFIQSFVSDLAVMENNLLRDMLAGQLADELRVPESNVLALLQKQVRRSNRPHRERGDGAKRRSGYLDIQSAADRAELELLRMHISENRDILDWLLTSLTDEDVQQLRFRELFQLLRGRLRKEFPIKRARLLDEIESGDIRSLMSRLIAELDDVPESITHADACLGTIRREQNQKALETLRQELRQVEKKGGDVSSILAKIADIKST